MKQQQFTFDFQKFEVDYLILKVNDLNYNESRFADYFFKKGFNCYKSFAKPKRLTLQPILIKEQNDFKVKFRAFRFSGLYRTRSKSIFESDY